MAKEASKEFTKGGKPKKMKAKINYPERLMILVSSIKCHIFQAEYTRTRGKGETPNPFVCFMSTPKEAVRMGMSKWENMFRKVGVKTLKTSKAKGEEDTEVRTMMGWPRTKKMTNTFLPEWGAGEETQFKVRTHQDGDPIDLSGAIMQIVVMDHQGGTEPVLVGSFTLNLAKLLAISSNRTDKKILKSRKRYEWMKQTGWSQKDDPAAAAATENGSGSSPIDVGVSAKPAPKGNEDETATDDQDPLDVFSKGVAVTGKGSCSTLTRKPSKTLRDAIRRQLSDKDLKGKPVDRKKLEKQVDSELHGMEALSLQLDEPILEGAVEVGRIACTIDTWMEDDIVQAAQPK